MDSGYQRLENPYSREGAAKRTPQGRSTAGPVPSLPERGRLRQIVVEDKPLSPEGMWNALQDVYFLFTRDLLVIYLPRLGPFEGACPEKSCELDLKK